jgi:hypothetical protein
MLISEYRALDEAARQAARQHAQRLAGWAGFGAAKLLLTEAAERVRECWPTAVAVVLDTQPYEHYNGLLTVQGDGEQSLWTRAGGPLDGTGDAAGLADAAHEIAQLIGEARQWKTDVLDEVHTWQYVMWLVDWLEPQIDDPDQVPPDATVYVLEYEHRHGTTLTAHTSIAGVERAKAALARQSWHEIADLPGVPDEPPADDADAARIYFDAHEATGTHAEHAHTHVLTIEDGIEPDPDGAAEQPINHEPAPAARSTS